MHQAHNAGKWQAGQVLKMSRKVSLLTDANAIANETIGRVWTYDVATSILSGEVSGVGSVAGPIAAKLAKRTQRFGKRWPGRKLRAERECQRR
jgi:hypothetical protein